MARDRSDAEQVVVPSRPLARSTVDEAPVFSCGRARTVCARATRTTRCITARIGASFGPPRFRSSQHARHDAAPQPRRPCALPAERSRSSVCPALSLPVAPMPCPRRDGGFARSVPRCSCSRFAWVRRPPINFPTASHWSSPGRAQAAARRRIGHAVGAVGGDRVDPEHEPARRARRLRCRGAGAMARAHALARRPDQCVAPDQVRAGEVQGHAGHEPDPRVRAEATRPRRRSAGAAGPARSRSGTARGSA